MVLGNRVMDERKSKWTRPITCRSRSWFRARFLRAFDRHRQFIRVFMMAAESHPFDPFDIPPRPFTRPFLLMENVASNEPASLGSRGRKRKLRFSGATWRGRTRSSEKVELLHCCWGIRGEIMPLWKQPSLFVEQERVKLDFTIVLHPAFARVC